MNKEILTKGFDELELGKDIKFKKSIHNSI